MGFYQQMRDNLLQWFLGGAEPIAWQSSFIDIAVIVLAIVCTVWLFKSVLRLFGGFLR